MHIDIISAVPELLSSPFDHSIIKRAKQKNLLNIEVHDLRKFGVGRYNKIDDYPYSGGPGMLLRPEPLAECIDSLRAQAKYDEVIFLSPDGTTLKQNMANALSLKKRLMLICGHYKGIDQRIRDHYVTMEISIGDYVLTGGELAAAVLVDCIGRLLPGVIGDESSALTDSFQDGRLTAPAYTRPQNFRGWKVPDILLSGHKAKITDWQYDQALTKTKNLRPDLLEEE